MSPFWPYVAVHRSYSKWPICFCIGSEADIGKRLQYYDWKAYTGFMFDTRIANQEDIQEIVSLGGGFDQDRLEVIQSAIDSGNCWVSGRSSTIESFIVLGPKSFFQRDFVQLLFVKPSARRRGMASALFENVESVASTDKLFTSTNQSNNEMQALLKKRGYTIAGIINHLDPGDPEMIFVKQMK